MVGGERINAGLDIGEVLLEKAAHIRIEASAVRYGRTASIFVHLVAAPPPITGALRGCVRHTKRCAAADGRRRRHGWRGEKEDCSLLLFRRSWPFWRTHPLMGSKGSG